MRPNLVPVVPFVVSFIYETVQKFGGVQLNSKEALAFIKRHGVVLQSARGPVPSLAEAVAGGPIRGSWWGHPRGRGIFRAAEAITESDDVLVCKLGAGKVTHVHRRPWPALGKLAAPFGTGPLAQVWAAPPPPR